jgi:lysozyme family protein
VTLALITRQDPVAGFSIAKTLPLEGGLVDNPKDPGGLTNFGVSLRWAIAEAKLEPSEARWLDADHDGHITRKDIAGLTKDQAADIYFECWWLRGWYGRLAPQMVAWKCFDIAVNTGPKRAAIILQRALGDLKVDVGRVSGVNDTIVAAVQAQAKADGGAKLLAALRAEQAAFYTRICVLQPELVTFKKGWLVRAAL